MTADLGSYLFSVFTVLLSFRDLLWFNKTTVHMDSLIALTLNDIELYALGQGFAQLRYEYGEFF